MTEEEIEVIAEELAKVGGLSWHPDRPRGPFLKAVDERYKDRARVMIAALERLRASKEGVAVLQDSMSYGSELRAIVSLEGEGQLKVGATVVYRPPGDMRAISCRVEKLEDDRVYLVPSPRPDIGWVSLENHIQQSSEGDEAA